MSLLLGVLVLAGAVLLGGVAALFREPARGAVSALRTFAVVAAVAIALLHLLPEAIGAVGWGALVATALGALGPAALERFLHARGHAGHDAGGDDPAGHGHPHDDAPTTALAMGYAAVVAHQAGEGAALASLASAGGLSLGIVLAIAAHTVPLAMVVAIRVIEAKARRAGSDGSRGPRVAVALAGVAGATAVGAIAGTLVGGDRLRAVQPWLLALVAGLLLHALAHDAPAPRIVGLRARVVDAVAGLSGLALACFGVERGDWLDRVPWGLRALGVAVVASAIAARTWIGDLRRR